MPETRSRPGGTAAEVTLTPALVRQVAERVFALWQRDLAVARERSGRRLHSDGAERRKQWPVP